MRLTVAHANYVELMITNKDETIFAGNEEVSLKKKYLVDGGVYTIGKDYLWFVGE